MQRSSRLTVSFSVLIRTERLQAVSVTYCILQILFFPICYLFLLLFCLTDERYNCYVNKACQLS